MASFITKVGALGSCVSATTSTIPTASRLLAVAPTTVVPVEKRIVHIPGRKPLTADTWGRSATSGVTLVSSGVGGNLLHTHTILTQS